MNTPPVILNRNYENKLNETYQPIGGRPMTAKQLKAIKAREKFNNKNKEKYEPIDPIGKTGQQECARIFMIVEASNDPKLANDIICGFYSIKEAEKCVNYLRGINADKKDKYQIVKVLVYHKVHKWIRHSIVSKDIKSISAENMQFEKEDIHIEKKDKKESIENDDKIKTAPKAQPHIVCNPNNPNEYLVAFNKATYALTVANGLDDNNVIIEKVDVYSRLTNNMIEYFAN